MKNEAEDQLEELIGKFLQELPANIAVVGTNGHYKYWSRAFQKNVMLGMPDEDIFKIDLFGDDYHLLRLDGNVLEKDEHPFLVTANKEKTSYSLMMGLPIGQDWNWVGATIVPRKSKNGDVLDFVCFYQLISNGRQAEADFTLLAFQDRLTGLPNRAFFTKLLSNAIYDIAEQGGRVGVMFLDLNLFSKIIDISGYHAGDKILTKVAKRLRGIVQHKNLLSRLGGDEFALLLTGDDVLAEAQRLSGFIRAAFEKPLILEGQEYFVDFNQGISVTAKPETVPDDLIRNAEVAMTRAKAKGTLALEVHDQNMDDITRRNLILERDMRYALERNEFTLYYQPLVSLLTGKICGWEALIRWNHPDRGLVMPTEFIPLAEEMGIILQIGTWVIGESCRQAQKWREKYSSHSKCIINVNLSMRQFQQQYLPQIIRGVLDETGLDPALLKLEITESAAMKDAATSLNIMTALKSLRINLAIDDFGTDYSSLSYLKRLPVDSLKIDKSFVDGLGLDKENTAITDAILSLAKALDISTTAEGIENENQLKLLREMGCHIGQGYYFSLPLPPEKAEKLIEQDPVW
ncbi:MAG: bifunctional diguanylate cyclase/phosphodiesterase [Holophagales bacterium]|nr:bifunctional diguanylate cyclase/phosphodiesterase [Holophagales bacterium]